MMHRKILLGVVFLLLISTATALAFGATGSGPNDALVVPTGTATIGSNTTLWFFFDYAVDSGSNGSPGGLGGLGGPGGPGVAPLSGRQSAGQPKANVALDANGTQGLEFAIYTPEQAADWEQDPATTPVGRGMPFSSGSTTHDLYWSGGFNTSGRYFIAVTNDDAVPLTFTLTVTGETVSLGPMATLTPTPTESVPITVKSAPTGTVQGEILFETATGGQIYSVNGDGSNLQAVSHGIDPAWSPDGKMITFARWDNAAPGIYVADADGSNERIVFTTPRARWPRFSADGRYVAFSQDKSKSDQDVSWKLGVVDLDTGKLTEPQCSKMSYLPIWNNDGTKIYYTDPDRVIMQATIAAAPATLIGPTASYWDSLSNQARPLVNWPSIQGTTLSPDGQQFAFSMKAHDRWEINVMSVYGGAQMGVTGPDDSYYLLKKVTHNVAPAWSPDGKKIMFLSDRNGRWEFFTADVDGGNVTQVLKNVTDVIAIKYDYVYERMIDWR